ncbi:c-type cytochrome [Inhella proteolytica]|uniref:C-type cytochrome n=1 Tax=Inhella proteolytica TaxID=2795029 RepID=A0A931NFM1_9BURK|nr:cytochrome c [Inhella proteolytica]MBH9576241.1 c-type cytochrome [Inhella proteolytica]
MPFRLTPRPTVRSLAVWMAAGLGLLACSAPRVEFENTQPAKEQARQQAQAAGSLYGGWRVYQQRCASCHGEWADGAGGAPNLLLRVRDLGPQRFVDLVLRRYSKDLLPEGGGTPRETLVDEVLERRSGALSMPAWQGDPVVQAHVMDLYAYLNARAEGRQGTERPAR